MNPHYLQQQNSHNGTQPQNLPYGESNDNHSINGSLHSQPYATNIPGSGPPSSSNMPPANQNSIVDQMSNISLSQPRKPPTSQGFPMPNASNSPFPHQINGVNNQNHSTLQNDSNTEVAKEHSYQSSQQVSSVPQSSNTSFTRAPQILGQQYSGQPPTSNSMPISNIPRNNQQTGSINNQNHQSQSQMQRILLNQQRPPMPNQSQGINQPAINAPLLTGPISSTTPIENKRNLSALPVAGQNFPAQANQSRPPIPGQTTGQQNLSNQYGHVNSLCGMSGSSLPGQNFNGPPMSNQNLSGPPMPNQNLSGPPMPNQNLSGPPLSNQMNSGSPLTRQPNYQSQNPYANQGPGQRQYPTGPSFSVPPNNAPPTMNQNFQQQNYGPGQPPMYGGQPGMYPGNMPSSPGGYPTNTQAAQGGRIDPDQMPNPISVIQENQRTRGGDFITNQKGLVPPLVTTKFVVHDQGNSSPRFIRSSMYTIPTTADIIKQAAVPFGIILNPMAHVEEGEYNPPIVDMGQIGPVRCNRCKAYMCPFMQFVDAGRRFQCMFCKATTEVPTEYFQHLDHAGQRMDRYERPELMLGTFEYIATKEYCRENTLPKPPALIFIIDVSYNNMKSGLVQLLCTQMKNIIRNLPVDAGQSKSNMKVGFITYNKSVHFYNCKPNLAQPQMLFVGDVEDVFMPLLEGFLCDVDESEATIDSLMSQIPAMFGETRETETLLGPAIQAGLEALKASECAGKLLVFHSTLPTSEAPGKLKVRDERNVLGTDKEKSVLAPQTNFYNALSQDCVSAGCSVDLFLFNNSYIDVATIGQVSRLTGGEVYKYTYFQVNNDGDRLITDIINNISRPIAFDAVMRVRTSTGVRPTDFYGHLYMSNTTDIELASIDCDKSIAIEIKHDDKLSDDEGVYIQAALLYTSCSGIRRLRIINLSLKTSSKISDLYQACDLDAIINFLLKQSVSKMVELSPKTIKDGLTARCAQILATYRKTCSSTSSSGQLILPECMKILPLYINCLNKFDALTGGAGTTIDQKSYVMMAVSSMPITESVVFIYPRLFALHNVDSQSSELPLRIRCTIDKFEDDGAYLLENGIHMFLWLGMSLNPQWVQAVFGVASVIQVDTDLTTIPELDNSLNKRIREVIATVQSERRYCMRLTMTRQREKMEMAMRQFLVEDRGADGSPSYVDYLLQMHREIRSLLS